MSMILLEGMGRSGTSLLARLMAKMLEPSGFDYYYEPFHHPSPAGMYDGWREMIAHVVLPDEEDSKLATYIKEMERVSSGKLFWKEIRLALRQDWLLRQLPEIKIVHITRDIMGVLSSHRRDGAPDWMREHRRIWISALESWLNQPDKLAGKGIHVPATDIIGLTEFAKYALIWVINEGFVLGLNSVNLLRIRYEDLCAQPKAVLSEIAEFTGSALEEEALGGLLQFMNQSHEGVDPSGPWRETDPSKMLEIWRKRLDLAEIEAIEKIAGAMRRQLGYPLI